MQTQQTDGYTMTIRELENEAADAASFDARILLTGERGVGKQTLARFIHERSRGAVAPFVIVDCADVSDAAFESEWVGGLTDTPGAHTKAVHGWLKRAEGGTIFIRGLERMTLRKQSALFRHLDARNAARTFGAPDSSSQDVRLIVAGCTSLIDAVSTGRFRADLFYRVNTVHIPIKPLWERPQDVPVLLGRFMRSTAAAQRRSTPLISTEAMRRLMSYSWPDNVRELKAVADDLMMHQASVVDPRVLPPRILQETDGAPRRRRLTTVNPQFGRLPRNLARSQ
jgi:DNA-binding NtrC family response regulator